MRWMWIDRVLELVPRQKMVAVKTVSLAEEHLHDHFGAAGGLPALPVMPACFMLEGMAQTGGVLVGHANDFREKVVLAKVNNAEITRDAGPGATLRYTAVIERMDSTGAATRGTIELIEPVPAGREPSVSTIGHVEMMFSHIDNNMTGLEFPTHNFVFGEAFKTLLRTSGF
jgi:3-hydroxyacyl-[acyl-carrier-protein] dehydratase